MIEIGIPRLKDFYNPVLQAVHRLGGSGTRQEILEEVIRSSGLTEEQLEKLLVEEDGRQSHMQYRVGYAQTHLKKAGFLENPSLGVWKLTDKGKAVSKVDPDEVSPRRKRPAVEMKTDGEAEAFECKIATPNRPRFHSHDRQVAESHAIRSTQFGWFGHK